MFPKMVSPSMYISHEDVDGVLLHYRTPRHGLCPYLRGNSFVSRDCSGQARMIMCFNFFVIGLLLQIAEDYFGIQLSVHELPSEPSGEDEYNQYRFRLNFNNRDYLASQKTMNGSNLGLERKMMAATPLSSNTLLRLFPFGLIFRSDLNIISTGQQLKIMFPNKGLIGRALPLIAKMRRPKVNLTWDNVTISCSTSSEV